MDSGVEKVVFMCAIRLRLSSSARILSWILSTSPGEWRSVSNARHPSQIREIHSKGMVVPLGAGFWWLVACLLMDVTRQFKARLAQVPPHPLKASRR